MPVFAVLLGRPDVRGKHSPYLGGLVAQRRLPNAMQPPRTGGNSTVVEVGAA